MKCLLRLFLLVVSVSVLSSAQVVDATICEILSKPHSFDGKLVRVKGTVSAGFDEFVIKDESCNQAINAIWLSYPEGTKGKAGPLVFVQVQVGRNVTLPGLPAQRTAVKLDKNKDFKQFDSLLSSAYKAHGMCLGCMRYTVTATLVGRLDATDQAGIVRDSNGKISGAGGFGNLNLYRARLVLQSVSDVSPHEVDFSGQSSASSDDSSHEGSAGDPVAATHQAAKAFGPESEAGKQVERAAAAYGAEGEDNGVQVGFGTPNEVPKIDSARGDKDSPDGLLLNCTFDMDRLKGDALARAMAHVGTHIADIRDNSVRSSYELENRAWTTTILSAVAYQQKTLTAPGGYLLWNSGWPASDRQKMVNDALAAFLTHWAVLKK